MNDIEIVISLETELVTPPARNNPKRLSNLLHEDFEEIGKSGKLYNKEETIEALRNEQNFKCELSDFRGSNLSKNIIVLKYLSCSNGISAHRTSVWVKNEQWQLLHHQGTITNSAF